MHYSYISAAFLALASTVVGQDLFDAIQTPQRDEVLPAGKPFDLVWNPLDVKGTATIRLLQGEFPRENPPQEEECRILTNPVQAQPTSLSSLGQS